MELEHMDSAVPRASEEERAMPFSTDRKKAMLGWAFKESALSNNIQFQKFLFFYECLSKVDGDVSEFSGLQGWKDGPVFSAVWGDMTYDKRTQFRSECEASFALNQGIINTARAKLAVFIVRILGAKLSEFTHTLDIWAKKEDRIIRGEKGVPLDEADFSFSDAQRIKELEQAYPTSYIDSMNIESFRGKSFLIPKSDTAKLTPEAREALKALALDDSLDSPVYVTFGEGGELLVD